MGTVSFPEIASPVFEGSQTECHQEEEDTSGMGPSDHPPLHLVRNNNSTLGEHIPAQVILWKPELGEQQVARG